MTVEEFERAGADAARREQLRNAAWQWIAAAGVAAAVIGLAWLVLSPPSADTLHSRIMAIATDTSADIRDARRPIEQFLQRYADDPRATAVREIKRTLDIEQLDRRSRRPRRSDKGLSPLERDYRAAIATEENGPSACLQAIQALLSVHARPGVGAPADEETSLWIELARRQAARLKPAAEAEQRDDAERIATIFAEAESLAAEADSALSTATRKQLAEKRTSLLRSVVEVYADRPHAADSVAAARRLLADPGASTPPESAAAAESSALPRAESPQKGE